MRFSCVVCFTLLALLVGCQKSGDTPIDPFHLPPFLSDLRVQPLTVNTDTMNVGTERLPTDSLTLSLSVVVTVSGPEGLQAVEAVQARFYKPASQTLIKADNLRDDGKTPDQAANDGLFAGQIPVKIVRADIGDFRVEVTARDKAGLLSNALSSAVRVVRLNRPPVLSDLKAPDSVSVSTAVVLVKLSIKATDPDGQSDIQKVFFNSYRPDGSLSTGNPFQMFDDGNFNGQSGDSEAGDGIYSLTVQLPTTTQRGTYRFVFQATDRSGAQSNEVSHLLRVQ